MLSKDMQALGKLIGDGVTKGLLEVQLPDSSFVPVAQDTKVYRPMTERERADEACGWTHCNHCCGPCPTCGLEGADYGDPER